VSDTVAAAGTHFRPLSRFNSRSVKRGVDPWKNRDVPRAISQKIHSHPTSQRDDRFNSFLLDPIQNRKNEFLVALPLHVAFQDRLFHAFTLKNDPQTRCKGLNLSFST